MATRTRFDRDTIRRVIALYAAGLDDADIAHDPELRGRVTARQAQSIRQAALGEVPNFDRALEVARVNAMQAVAYPKALRGDLDAMDRVLRLTSMREHLTAEPRENDHALRLAFEASVKETNCTDSALVAAGLAIADRVDEANATGEGQELTKALYLLPHLMNTLDRMLATPAARAKAEAEAAAMRAKAARESQREADAHGERARSTFANLTAIPGGKGSA